MTTMERPLGEVLVEMGLATREQLQFAAEEEERSGESAWKTLVRRGMVTENDLVRARAVQIGVEFAEVSTLRVPDALIERVPYAVARRQMALPVRIEADHIVFAVAEPRNHLTKAELESVAKTKVVLAAAYRPDLEAAIERAYTKATPQSLRAFTPSSETKPANGVRQPSNGTGKTASNSPVASNGAPATAASVDSKEPNFSDFLGAVIDRKASDLHLTAGVPPMMRIDGELAPIPGYRKMTPTDIQTLIYSILTQKQREIFEDRLELDVSYSMPGRGRFRVNVFQQRDSLGAVMRLIPFDISSLDDLGLPDVGA